MFFLIVASWTALGAQAAEFSLPALLGAGTKAAVLRGWTLSDIASMKQITSTEKDAGDGRLHRWKGVLLSGIVEKTLEKLQPDQRAHIDLVIFHGQDGSRAFVPRAFIVKYPVMLATHRDGVAVDGGSPVSIVVPWTSKPRILGEGLPVEGFFVRAVTRIEFANYRDLYADFFLGRRTDPAAMRGEKIFLQNCASCHAARSGGAIKEAFRKMRPVLGSVSHAPVKGGPGRISEKDSHALANYLEAYMAEH